jgi:curved DNA-binding protein CbpA
VAQGFRDAYQILQIHPSAVPEVVEAAYRALAMLHHPDLSKEADAVSAMAELNWAYTTLRDPEQRAAYDRTRVAIPVAVPGGSLSERVQENVVAAARDHDRPSQQTLDFGRYAGMTLGQVLRIDPEYLEWLKRHSSGVRYRHQVEELLARTAARRAG